MLHTRRNENIRRHGRIKKSRVSELARRSSLFLRLTGAFHPSRNLLQMSSFCLKYFSYIYSNMQWFLSGCNSQLSNLHPLKISNSLSTTLTQLRRQRRIADWVSISSVAKVDASTCLNITRSGSVFWRVREQQKTLQLSLLTKDLSPSNKEKMRFAYDEQGVMNKPNWKFPFHSTS